MDKATQSRFLIFRELLFIAIGICLAGIGLKVFLLPNHFLDGGAMGVALLLDVLVKWELSVFIVIVNLPFIILGYQQISPAFAVKSGIAIVLLAVLVHFIQVPAVTEDKLLIAVFGGFFLGAGIGFTIRGGAVIDGTEVLAIYFSKKASLTVGDAITIFNVIIFGFAAFLINVETAMYSMLTYLAASKTVDFIINGIEEYIGVTIVSDLSDEIQKVISTELGRGVTIYKAEANQHANQELQVDERKVLYCVVTRLEVSKLLREIEKIDEKAFVVQQSLKDTKGGMIKKRPLH